VFFLAPAEP